MTENGPSIRIRKQIIMEKNTVNKVPENTSAPEQAAQAVQNNPKKKNKKLLVVVSVAAALGLSLGGFGIYKHFSDDDPRGSGRKKPSSSNSHANSDLHDLTDYSLMSDNSSNEAEDYDGPEESLFTQLGLSRDDNGDFQILTGSFDDKISSDNDAMHFIEAHSEEIGINDAADELKLVSEKSYAGAKYYKFQQVYNDVPVYGNQLIVSVDPDGVIDSVSGGYTPVDIDTDASLTKDEAEEIAKEYAGEKSVVIDDELVICPYTESGSAMLVYDIRVLSEDISAELFIDAESGDIVAENQLISALAETFDAKVDDKTYHVTLNSTSDSNYRLYDPERDITIKDVDKKTLNSISIKESILELADRVYSGGDPIYAKLLGKNSDGTANFDIGSYTLETPGTLAAYLDPTSPQKTLLSKYSFGALSGLENAYDYYYKTLGWKSIDGNGMPLTAFVGADVSLAEKVMNYEEIESIDGMMLYSLLSFIRTFKDEYNSCYVAGTNFFVFGALDGEPIVSKGILGHEFTHGVVNYTAHISPAPKYKTIDEGYADVIGSIITGDWNFIANEIPEKYSSILGRNAMDPHQNSLPAQVGDEYYLENPTDEHHNATVVSHSAYLMSQNGLTNDQIAKAYFASLFKMSSTPDFEESALSILQSVKLLTYNGTFSKEDVQKVAAALFETKMLDPDEGITINVHCGKHPIADAVVTINGKKVGSTDENGELIIDYEADFIGDVEICAKADGFSGLTQEITLLGEKEELGFNLAADKDFGKTHGSDDKKKGESSGETVTVTILDMAAAQSNKKAKPKAQDYSVQKGANIDLQKLVDSMKSVDMLQDYGAGNISTDGKKIYFDTGYVPVELSYVVYGTDDVFDFSQPIYENVVIEPKIGIGDFGLGEFSMDGQDLHDLADQLDEMFNH